MAEDSAYGRRLVHRRHAVKLALGVQVLVDSFWYSGNTSRQKRLFSLCNQHVGDMKAEVALKQLFDNWPQQFNFGGTLRALLTCGGLWGLVICVSTRGM